MQGFCRRFIHEKNQYIRNFKSDSSCFWILFRFPFLESNRSGFDPKPEPSRRFSDTNRFNCYLGSSFPALGCRMLFCLFRKDLTKTDPQYIFEQHHSGDRNFHLALHALQQRKLSGNTGRLDRYSLACRSDLVHVSSYPPLRRLSFFSRRGLASVSALSQHRSGCKELV